MRWSTLGAAATATVLLSTAVASPLTTQKRQSTANCSTPWFFDQLIDHTNPSLGTFLQRYYFCDQFWAGAGSPIILTHAGEQAADSSHEWLTDAYLPRGIMQILGAAGIVLEHRYFGQSSPFPDLTTQNLQYLTIDQSLADIQYFVQNVALPFTTGSAGSTTPGATPWVNVGCSYPGLLVSYAQEKYSDLFAASYASSAPVQAQGSFWQYYEPIEEGMPKNCSSDLAASIQYIDTTLGTGSSDDVKSMKSKFGLQSLENDDFAYVISKPLFDWQTMLASDYHTEGETRFFHFCDTVETTTNNTTNMQETGVGLPQALTNYARAIAANYNDCPTMGGACQSTYNYSQPFYTNTSVTDQFQRQWQWLLCTELSWFQVGDPFNSSSLVSVALTQYAWIRQCNYRFPNADGTPGNFSPSAASINAEYKGWSIVADNLFVVNGQFDPWRSASISSSFAPAYVDTPTQPVTVIPNAHHCWDWYLEDTVVDSNVAQAQDLGISTIHGWLQSWYAAHPTVQNHLSATPASITTIASSAVNASSTNNATVDSTTINGPLVADAETIPGTTIGAVDDATSSLLTSLQNQIASLKSSQNAAIASYVFNGVLLLLLVGCGIALARTRRRSKKLKRQVAARWGSKGSYQEVSGEQKGAI